VSVARRPLFSERDSEGGGVRTSSLNLVELLTRRRLVKAAIARLAGFTSVLVPSPALIEASLRVTAEFSLGAARCR
jgi:hypothetical protein